MENIKDIDGYNQIWGDSKATRIRSERRSKMMINEFDKKEVATILEIGCGTGTNSYFIAKETKHIVVGADICEPFIKKAKSTYACPNLSYEVLDFNEPDQIKDKKFDYIIGNGILHHLYYSLDQTLQNFKLLLKEGGKIVFMEPNIYNPYCAIIFKIPIMSRLANLEPDEMAFSKGFITKILTKNGFTKIKVEYRDFLLPGVPDFVINPLIKIGDVLEKTPLKVISQSIFITAHV